MGDAEDLGGVPPELATPFRRALVRRGLVAAASLSRNRLTTHLVSLKRRQALCGAPRPSGVVSDMTKYTYRDQVCRKCLAQMDRSRHRKATEEMP